MEVNMAYRRRGGSGKSGTLREQFNYYKRQLKNRLIQEQAFEEARGGISLTGIPYTMFQNLNYNDIFTKGITRKVGNRTIRYQGAEAVQIQIESLKRRASKSYQADIYINNYLTSLRNVDMPSEMIMEVEKLLRSISSDRLTLLVDEHILPSIQFLYSQELDYDEILDDIRHAIKFGVTQSRMREIQSAKKSLVPYIKEKFNMMKWL